MEPPCPSVCLQAGGKNLELWFFITMGPCNFSFIPKYPLLTQLKVPLSLQFNSIAIVLTDSIPVFTFIFFSFPSFFFMGLSTKKSMLHNGRLMCFVASSQKLPSAIHTSSAAVKWCVLPEQSWFGSLVVKPILLSLSI